MKVWLCFLLLALIPITSFHLRAETRTFTDDQGRQIEAELVGMRGENVVIRKNGRLAQWPVAKLSQGDQRYVAIWKKKLKSAPAIQVRIWERDGMGEKGVLNQDRLSDTLGKNIPVLKSTEETGYYRHYDVDLHNHSPVDAGNLFLAYTLYVITPSNQVISEGGSETVTLIPAAGRETVKTQGITYVRSKTTTATFGTNILGNLQMGSSTNRSKEKFGGAWVRVFAADGKMVGEAKDLIPQLEKMNPEWVGEKNAPSLPMPTSFDLLEEILAPLKEVIEKLPEPPANLPVPPGRPPFLPK